MKYHFKPREKMNKHYYKTLMRIDGLKPLKNPTMEQMLEKEKEVYSRSWNQDIFIGDILIIGKIEIGDEDANSI